MFPRPEARREVAPCESCGRTEALHIVTIYRQGEALDRCICGKETPITELDLERAE